MFTTTQNNGILAAAALDLERGKEGMGMIDENYELKSSLCRHREGCGKEVAMLVQEIPDKKLEPLIKDDERASFNN